ncbi:hypothetical protein MUK42_07270 [Musa troglodytarum]|uniref:Secreted protein n=1 Tax=Musa troglodytarum TaxID=320322 RepID=A0A9E7JXG1_9LILI|nr:hypothetical protein MUK42_07270 [Musa troglodytarum]
MSGILMFLLSLCSVWRRMILVLEAASLDRWKGGFVKRQDLVHSRLLVGSTWESGECDWLLTLITNSLSGLVTTEDWDLCHPGL